MGYAALGIVVVWLVLVVAYFGWAIHFYNINLGMTSREWKVISPEIYASPKEHAAYVARREAVAAALNSDTGGAPTSSTACALLLAPKANPYRRDSFGLPPGTIRGVLALTVMIVFVVAEVARAFGGNVEADRVADIRTVFEMVLAFYFGSRAVEVLQKASTVAKPVADALNAAKQTAASQVPPAEPRPPEQRATALAGTNLQPAVPENDRQTVVPPENPALPSNAYMARLVSMEPSAKEGTAISVSATPEEPLANRVLTLTACFETGLPAPDCFGVLAGDFDGQGISFGALQWNIGTGSLQPLLVAMREQYPQVMKDALGKLYDELSQMLDRPRGQQMDWARGIQRVSQKGTANVWNVATPWKEALFRLGTTPQFIELEVGNAAKRYAIALESCAEWGLDRERGVALMFDINVQNGQVDRNGSGGRIRQDVGALPASLSEDERQLRMMEIIARRRAEVSSPPWRADVLTRKLTIAQGKGRVHTRDFDLATQFHITMKKVAELPIRGAA